MLTPAVGRPFLGHNLIFIVGCPRSGTTWLQRLLASHPRIETGQESNLFNGYIGPQIRTWNWELNREKDPRTATGRGGIGLPCYFLEEEFMAILRDYLIQLLRVMMSDLESDKLFVEKTPSHALFVPEIRQLLPESRVIHVLRDARDVTASLLAAKRTWGRGWAPRRTSRAASMWVRHVQAVREAATHMSDQEFHEVRYEELLTSAETALKKLSEFLCIEWRPNDIEKAIRKNQAYNHGTGGTPIPIRGEIAKQVGDTIKDPPGLFERQELVLGEKISHCGQD